MDLAVRHATENREHKDRVYTFVVDYGQNMELPSYRKKQPGCTYYYSPLSVYNLGVVNHGHVYYDGHVAAHLHAHVYHEGVAKKGATNVTSLIVKTLRHLNVLQEDSIGGELNIIFDNCGGQNKNNTVIRLAAWLSALGYFKVVNFIFLVVGHTKNVADRLFNCLKLEYPKQNLFTFQDMVEALNRSEMVTVHPANPEDFRDYDKLMNTLFRKGLYGNIKKNHIFTCACDGSQMLIRQSDLADHREYVVHLRKNGQWDISREDIVRISGNVLAVPLPYTGLNPYKMVEMFAKYRPVVPVEFQSDELYAEPSREVYSKVKTEKID